MKKEIKKTFEEITQMKMGKIFITFKNGEQFEIKLNTLTSIKLTEEGIVVKEFKTPTTTIFIEFDEIRSVGRQYHI